MIFALLKFSLLFNFILCINELDYNSEYNDNDDIFTVISNKIKTYNMFTDFLEEFHLDLNQIEKLILMTVNILKRILRSPPPIPKFDPHEWWGSHGPNKQDKGIRPFHIHFNDSSIIDLKKRLKLTRELIPALHNKHIGQTYGTHSAFLDSVIDHWLHKYDFSRLEEFLNQYDHYVTNIQGLDIHFVHVHPKHPGNRKVLPALLLHGGGVTFREFFDLIPHLTNPRSGYDFVYELIIPSLPGHGFSEATTRKGLGYHKIAVIMRNLMHRLGFKQYFIQAGDFGHFTAAALSTLYPEDVLGFHSNLPFSLRTKTLVKYLIGALNPSSVVEKKYENRMYPLSKLFYYYLTEFGYFHMQATKPDSIVSVDQSPAGMLGWFLEKYIVVTNYDKRKKWDGDLDHFVSLQAVLDEMTLFWMTKTAQTSFRLYAESTAFIQDPVILDLIDTPVMVPFAAIKFRYEVIYQPDDFIRDKYPNLVHSTTLDFGGHFAGKENPDVLAHDFFESTEEFMMFNRRKELYNE